MELRAYAKINLGLDVLRRREDGYHELRMVMQTVTLHDRIRLTVTEAPGIRIRTNVSYIPDNQDNLACRSAALLLEEFPQDTGIYIDLDKHIPVAAGLAGGSSDAAAVMVGMNQLLSLGLSREELMERAVKIGADVPYCILRGTELAEGIGEKLTVLPSPPEAFLVLVKPPVHVSTAFVYKNLNVQEIGKHPDIDGQITALKEGDLEGLAGRMGNVLETVTSGRWPEIAGIRGRLLQLGALGARMSGSGPSVFGIFTGEQEAKAAAAQMRAENVGQVFLTEWFPSAPKGVKR